MKKLALTLAIVLGLGMVSFADNGGLFGHGENVTESNTTYEASRPLFPVLPTHNQGGNQPAAPLGSGVVMLIGLGAAYVVTKKRREE